MTRIIRIAGTCALTALLLAPSVATAADSEASDKSETESFSNLGGFQMQARAKMGSLLSRAQPTPGLVLGYRGSRYSIGVSGNWARFRLSQTSTVVSSSGGGPSGSSDTSTEEQEFTVKGNLIQILPTFKYDLFVSEDGQSHFGPTASIGYGIISSSSEQDGSSEDLLQVDFVPVRVAANGEYFFSEHFGVGVEGGLQFSFVTNIESGGESVDASFGSNVLYGAVTAIFVL